MRPIVLNFGFLLTGISVEEEEDIIVEGEVTLLLQLLPPILLLPFSFSPLIVRPEQSAKKKSSLLPSFPADSFAYMRTAVRTLFYRVTKRCVEKKKRTFSSRHTQ